MLQEQARICGAFDRGSPHRLSILRNANVGCLYHLFMPMSHVEFKKRTCHPVDFRGQGPDICLFL